MDLPDQWHDTCVRATLHHLQEAEITLNGTEQDFSKTSVRFLSSISDIQGKHTDTMNSSYMLRIPTESLEDLQPFMDMLNYGKFIQHLDNQWDKQTLHHLICKDNNWLRAGPQQRSLDQMKPTLVSDDRLALYGPNQPTIHSQWLLERVLPQGSFRSRRNESLALLAMHDDHLTKMLQ